MARRRAYRRSVYGTSTDTGRMLSKSLSLNFVQSLIIAALAVALVYMALNAHTSVIVNQATSPNSSVSTTSIAGSTTNATPITVNSSGTLAGIDQPLNASAMAVINDAPLSYYDTAAAKLLNNSLTNEVVVSKSPQFKPYIINGKPTVIYIGATTCPFCGENRWAMALALSRFGNFTHLYYGYSALHDGDVPTLYWSVDNLTTQAGVDFDSNYSSGLINFIAAEYESPITGQFEVQPLSYFISLAPNATYRQALQFMNATGQFTGTPFTFWGTSLMLGADAVVVGNNASGGFASIASMTHAQILKQLSEFNDQFAWGEYAAADVYAADLCNALKNSSVAICQLPSIRQLGAKMGLSI